MPIPSLINSLWRSRLNIFRHRACLDMLPDDIMVDLVFEYLLIDDFLALRQTSKYYYALSHHPSIWKRFLCEIELPLPPIPPTRQHALGKLSGFEAERLVIRACSLDNNWRSKYPRVYNSRTIAANENNEVLEMALVPGAHYMVASAAPHSKYFYRLTLYTLDHKIGSCIPIAEMRTGTKAYNLQARYMVHKGKQGIMITYTRRCLRYEDDCDKGLDPSFFCGDQEVDSYLPLEYEVNVVHVSLDDIESIVNDELEWGSDEYFFRSYGLDRPFTFVVRMNANNAMQKASLELINDEPHVVCIVNCDRILFKNLATDVKSSLKCHRWDRYPDFEQRISAFRVIPEQNQVMVVREIVGDPSNKFPQPLYPLEIYNLPNPGKDHYHCIERETFEFVGSRAASFDFSPHHPRLKYTEREGTHPYDKSAQPTIFGWTEHTLPPPISLYVRLSEPDGFLHTSIWPQRAPGSFHAAPEDAEYMYSLTHMVAQMQFDFGPDADSTFGATRVIPGAERALILAVPSEYAAAPTPPLRSLWAYCSPEDRGDLPEEHEDDAQQRAFRVSLRLTEREHSLGQVMLPEDVWKMLRDGVGCLAWDEWTGRVCAVAENSAFIHVLDFAQSPRIDKNGERTPMAVPWR